MFASRSMNRRSAGSTRKRRPSCHFAAKRSVVPKRVLVGAAIERVDTRVMQIIYALTPGDLPALPGQQVDVYIEEEKAKASLNMKQSS